MTQVKAGVIAPKKETTDFSTLSIDQIKALPQNEKLAFFVWQKEQEKKAKEQAKQLKEEKEQFEKELKEQEEKNKQLEKFEKTVGKAKRIIAAYSEDDAKNKMQVNLRGHGTSVKNKGGDDWFSEVPAHITKLVVSEMKIWIEQEEKKFAKNA